MRRLSIKMKITLWYTGILAGILAVIFVLMLFWMRETGLSVTEEELQGAVTGFTENINIENDTFYLESDTEFYDEGIMFCIYDENGKRLYGSLPVGFPENTILSSNESRQINIDDKNWMIYDLACTYSEGKNLWIRGITSVHNMELTIDTIVIVFLILFPILILFIGLIGYLMIKKTLKPVENICNVVDEISEGKDLSKRLPPSKIEKEIFHLTESFNHMFERLQNSFEKEEQFTSDVSHELRTPVAVMIAHAEYLLKNSELTKEQEDEIKIILEQSQRMSNLISQLLYMSKEDRIISRNQFEEVDLSILAQIVAEELEIEAEKKSIHIVTEIEDNAVIRGDQTLLMRMLLNLIHNAILYGKENGNIIVTIKNEPDCVIGSVQDDGIGISDENQDKIWNRFYRVDESRDSSAGMGLGLSMVKWIVKKHDGDIKVESKLNEGSTFTFILPKDI